MDDDDTYFRIIFVYSKKYLYTDQAGNNDALGYPWCFVDFKLKELMDNFKDKT